MLLLALTSSSLVAPSHHPPLSHAPLLRSAASAALPPLSRAALLRSAAAALVVPLAAKAELAPSFEAGTKAAFAAFAAGDYKRAELLWSRAVEAYPDSALAFGNLATLLIINASDEMTLGQLPTGDALRRLERALEAIDQAEALGTPRADQPVGRGSDAVLLNSRGNALGLLQRWEEAQEAYTTSADSAAREFASIPRSNAALVAFERRQEDRAEREVRTLLRRDPNFVDATALLAALRWSQGDIGGATATYASLCETPIWCETYASDTAVLGRWTPRAVEAFRGLLAEPAVQRERKNAAVLKR